METVLFIAMGAVVAMGLTIVVFLKTRNANPVRVTAADIPRVLDAVSSSTKTPAFADFVFTTPDQPNRRDAVHLQFSLENGSAGLDWLLLGPRNIKDKDRFIEYVRGRGYSYSERNMIGIPYLRIEDGDLAQLCADVVTKFYARRPDEAMDLIVKGFDWTT